MEEKNERFAKPLPDEEMETVVGGISLDIYQGRSERSRTRHDPWYTKEEARASGFIVIDDTDPRMDPVKSVLKRGVCPSCGSNRIQYERRDRFVCKGCLKTFYVYWEI